MPVGSLENMDEVETLQGKSACILNIPHVTSIAECNALISRVLWKNYIH
jgi:hypothetical protein